MKKLLVTICFLFISLSLFAETSESETLNITPGKTDWGSISLVEPVNSIERIQRHPELYAHTAIGLPRIGSIIHGGVGVNIHAGNWYVPIQVNVGVDTYILTIGTEYQFLTIPFGQTDRNKFYIRSGLDIAGGLLPYYSNADSSLFGGLYGTMTLGISFPTGKKGAWFIHLRPAVGAAYGTWRSEEYYNGRYYEYTYETKIGFSSLITFSTGYRF